MTATPSTNTVVAEHVNDLDGFLNDSLEDPAFAAAYRDAQARSDLRLQLIRLRRKSGLNQTQVAAAMQTTQSAVSVFESGECEPYLSTLQRYAQAIGVEVAIAIKGHGSKIA